MLFLLSCILLSCVIPNFDAFPEQGVWNLKWKKDTKFLFVSKSMLNNSGIFLKIQCKDGGDNGNIRIQYLLRSSVCAEEYTYVVNDTSAKNYFSRPNDDRLSNYYPSVSYKKGKSDFLPCDPKKPIYLNVSGKHQIYDFPNYSTNLVKRKAREANDEKEKEKTKKQDDENKKMVPKRNNIAARVNFMAEKDYFYSTWMDAAYLLIIKIDGEKPESDFEADVTIRMKGASGYLSAIEKPFHAFYAVMCIVYALLAVVWLTVCALYWRDLLRLQYCISIVILLGLLEKAFFWSEYSTINETGQSVSGLVLTAEVVSIIKRTFSRILVMIVCIGYGIVKPRLGEALRKVWILGVLYFVFALIEGISRTMRPRFSTANMQLWILLPLALTDATIFVLTFSYLIQTMQQLRARRNVLKHALYRHFSNVLILVICASGVFMAWATFTLRFHECTKYWRDLWVDEAFWHVLFSVVLMAIMWLWRPSENNIRYAYSPVLDSDQAGLLSDAEIDDNDEDIVMDNSSDLRRKRSADKSGVQKRNTTEEELKWIDEHIPNSAVESAFPVFAEEENKEAVASKQD